MKNNSKYHILIVDDEQFNIELAAIYLKEDKKTKDIPIIFLTAQTDIEYISKAFTIGRVNYISKPVPVKEFKKLFNL